MISCTCAVILGALPGVSAADVPANGWVTWASNRSSGKHQIYLMKADGSGVTQLTTGGGTFPGWSPDGKWIAYRHANGTTHVLRWDGSGDKKVCDGEFLFWMHDNSGLVCGKSEKYYLVKPDNGTSSLLFKKSDFTRLGTEKFVPGGITHDGKYLLAFSGRYKGGFQGDNGVFGSTSLGVGHNSAIILDLNNKGKIYFFGYGCEPTTPPAGDWIYHVRGDKQHATYPDLYKMKMADLMSRSSYQGEMEHADADWGHEYFPRISNDNTWMVYGATTGCHEHATCDYEIFIHRLGAGYKNRTRLTQHKGNDTWPSLYVGKLWQRSDATRWRRRNGNGRPSQREPDRSETNRSNRSCCTEWRLLDRPDTVGVAAAVGFVVCPLSHAPSVAPLPAITRHVPMRLEQSLQCMLAEQETHHVFGGMNARHHRRRRPRRTDST